MKIKPIFLINLLLTFFIQTYLLGQNINDLESLKKKLSNNLKHGNYHLAEKSLNDILSIYKNTNQINTFASYLKTLAGQLNAERKIDASIYISKKTIEVANNYLEEKDTLVGFAYDFIGNNYLQKSLPDSALINYNQAVKYLANNGVQLEYAFSLIGKVVSHYYLGQFKEMEIPLNEVASISNTLEPKNETLTGLYFQLTGVLFDALGDYDKAIDLYKNALQARLIDSKLDSFSISTEYNNLGASYLIKGDYDLAIEYLEKSILLINKVGADQDALIRSYINIILSFSRKEDFSKATDYLNKAKEIIDNHNSIKKSPIYLDFLNVACYIFNDTAKPDVAIEYSTKLLTNTANASELFYLANLHLGRAYSLKSNFKKAADYFEIAYHFFQKNSNIINEGRNEIFIYLSEYYYDSKNFDESLKIAQNGIVEIVRDSNLINEFTNPSLTQSQYKSALLKLLFIKALALNKLYLKNNDTNYLIHSFETYELGSQVIDLLRNDHISAGSKQFLLKKAIPFYENSISTALEMYKVTGAPEYLEQAFVLNQKGKAILLLDRLNDAEAKVFSNLPDSLLQKEKNLKRDLSFYQKQIFDELQFKHDADTLKLEVWNEKVFNLKRSIEGLNAHLEQKFPQYFNLKYRPSLPNIKELSKYGLKKNELYLEYFVGDSTVYIFAISNNDVKVFNSPISETFQKDLTEIISQVSTMPTGDIKDSFIQFSQSSRRLFQQLIEPAIRQFPNFSSLLIVPHGQLSFLPFEILLYENVPESTHLNFGKLPYLIKKYAINYSPSAGILLKTKSKITDTQKKIKCTAFVPSYSIDQSNQLKLRNNLASLPGAEREVDLLSKCFPGDYFYGKNATEANFKAIAGKYDLIHLAMHGVANRESAMYSKLIFNEDETTSEDNNLHVYEIYGMMLKAKLVVLSSCQSGFGKYIHGEGVVSLAQGFLQAGSQAVTMSLWEAQDGSTAYIMGKYYKNLHQGMAKNIALQQAKLEYLVQSSHQKHPFFWAAFVNVGNDSSIVEGDNLFIWMLLGILLMGIVSLYFFHYHKKKR